MADSDESPPPATHLDYESALPDAQPATSQLSLAEIGIRCLPLAAYAALSRAGVGSDRVQIPGFRKALLAAAVFATLTLLSRTARPRHRLGLAYISACWVVLLIELLVMAYWN